MAQGLLRPFQVEGLRFVRQFRIVYHKNKYISQAARDFMSLCQEKLSASPLAAKEEKE